MSYTPGTHLIATLTTEHEELLHQYGDFALLVNDLIAKHDLQKLGEVYHNFSPCGYTAVVCLSESHLSIHTWPEHKRVNIDIYLSNYQRSNDGTVSHIYEAIKHHFKAAIEQEHFLKR